MRPLFLCAVLALLTACKGDIPSDTAEDSEAPDVSLAPMQAELVLSATFRQGLGYAGYAVAGTDDGVLTHKPGEEAVYLVPWDAGQGVVIEDIAITVATSPYGTDALLSDRGVVTLAGGLMGPGLSSIWPAGIGGVVDSTLEAAPLTILGSRDGGYTGKTEIADFDGDGLDDVAVMEGTIPGYVRVFADFASRRGQLSADAAGITIEACGGSLAYGPTFVAVFGDGLVAVGCASSNYHSGDLYIFDWPLTDGAGPIDIFEEAIGGWHGASRGLGYPLLLDVRGAGELGVLSTDGETIDYVYPDGASALFGATPKVVEAGGRWYAIVGDQGYDAEDDGAEGSAIVCDITDEAAPDGDWYADCLTLSTPQDVGLECMGAAVDLDASADGGLRAASTGWCYADLRGEGFGVGGWHIYR